MAKNKEYKVGIYVRLSKEDTRSGESVSIENQKLLLSKHVDEMGWELRDIYQDDGFSGTNQNRPGFQRMIADVKSGFINTILIKDLSRLGRNYLEVGNLAEVFLPEHGCELISLGEKLDDMMVFRNWFNEQHSKTTSVKVRSAKRVSAQSGKFLGPFAPFGYRKDPQNRHKLIVDETAAPIVRRIFQMRLSGLGFRAIAIQLNEDEVICPREYYYQQKGSKNPLRSRKIWGETTIKDIIRNEVYLGHLVSGKTGTISYKNQKLVKKDAEDWVRVENTHTPIVDRETWDRVHSYVHRNYRPRKRSDGGTNLFTGLLYCADCGFRLRGHVERRERRDGSEYRYTSYMCGTYGNNGKKACTCHGIGEKVLIELVRSHIQKYALMLTLDEARIMKSIASQRSSATMSYQGTYESELASHQKQLEKLDFLIENLCADKASGVIPESLFKRQILRHEQERGERSKAVLLLEKRLKEIKPAIEEVNIWGKLIKRYTEMDTLDKETLLLLIDKIIVNETKVVDGKRICDIQVVYNYVGNVDGAVAV
jgi:DNA invertase Pin-like site-specific DNA recombinase